MTLTDEMEIIDDNIKTNQAQYNLYREAAKFLHYHLMNRKNIKI